ncbi:molecular chaperone Hsp20 [Halobacteriales archaeon QS_8_69_26]|nr:MAG: molecular chaperone Hsp20 [Halobacteriales archaeon QS_8_69_26]
MSALRGALRDLPDTVFADLLESEDAYLLVIDLPGVTAETVDVTVEDRRIRIEARREKDVPPEFRYVTEDRSLFLDADLPLPRDAASEGGSASVDRGVLELRVPKRGEGTATNIEIDDADDE